MCNRRVNRQQHAFIPCLSRVCHVLITHGPWRARQSETQADAEPGSGEWISHRYWCQARQTSTWCNTQPQAQPVGGRRPRCSSSRWTATTKQQQHTCQAMLFLFRLSCYHAFSHTFAAAHVKHQHKTGTVKGHRTSVDKTAQYGVWCHSQTLT